MIKIDAMADGKLWEEMHAWSKQEWSPVGIEPFIEACLKRENFEQARLYIPKVDFGGNCLYSLQVQKID